MNLIEAKIAAVFGLAVPSLAFGLLPLLLYRIANRKGLFESSYAKTAVLSIISFSGGALLGMAFLHLLPDMRIQLHHIASKDSSHSEEHENHQSYELDLPWGDIITVVGFFSAYLLDEVVHILVERYFEKEARNFEASPDNAAAVGKIEEEILTVEPTGRNDATVVQMNGHSCRNNRLSHHFHDPHTLVANSLENDSQMSVARALGHHMVREKFTEDIKKLPSVRSRSNQRGASSLRGVLTVGALSLHEITEGLAVGIERTVPGVMFLFLSVAVHKYAVGFCIGADLAVSQTGKWPLIFTILTFSIVSPVGIVIGMILFSGEDGNAEATIKNSLVNAILQGIAGGNLIYIVCFEILQREATKSHKTGILSLVFVVLGFLFTLGAIIFGLKEEYSMNVIVI